MVKDHVFICEKNCCFGLIDGDGNTILHVSYEDITPYLEDGFFIVTTETGKFLFNLISGRMSEVYDNIQVIYEQIIFNIGEKYGLLNNNGCVLLPPKYKKPRWGSSHLLYEFQGFEFDVFVYNGLLYGKFPIVNEYDNLFSVGDGFSCFYVTEKDGKYGLLSDLILRRNLVGKGITRCISEPIFDEILLYKFKAEGSNHVLGTYFKYDRTDTYSKVFFVIVRLGEKYRLYNTFDGTCLLDGCDYISFEGEYKRAYYNKKLHREYYIEYSKDGKIGYLTPSGINISPDEYESINNVFGFFLVKRDSKYGVLYPSGQELFPCIYDNIQGDKFDNFLLTKDGITEKVHARRSPDDDLFDSSSDSSFIYDRPTYEKYAGTYAQDEMGYSDDDIDTIFDGEPDAYWNID